MRYVITGGASGIGLATAAALMKTDPEARILLADRSETGLHAAKTNLADDGRIETCLADLENADAPSRIIDVANATFGGLDGVVSNAGVVHGSALNDLDVDEFERVFRINTRAAWLLAKASHPLLKASRGAFVATTSIVATHPTPFAGCYGLSKAALVMLVRQLALEWAHDGIRCNCVSPGPTLTAMTDKALADPEQLASRERVIPAGRVGRAEDVANAIAFLLSPTAAFINGVDLPVDGGQAIALMFGSVPAISR